MLISFSKAVVSDSPLLRNLHSYHSIRHSTKPKTEKTFRCESNLIRDRQIQHSCRSIISDRKKFSHTLTLSFFGFGLFRETNKCTCSHDKPSASLYIRQDSIDMLHSITQGHAITAIGCTQKLMHLSPSGWTSVLRCLRRHSRTVQEEYMQAQSRECALRAGRRGIH